MPWQITSLTDVHTDFGKPRYRSGLGYTPREMCASCAMRSSSSVVTPGATAAPVSASTSRAIRPACRSRSITAGDFTADSVACTGVPVAT